MIDEIKNEDDEMIDVAKEANILIAQKDKELKELKLKLAKSELYRTVDDTPLESSFNPDTKFNPSGKTNYDIAKYAVNVHDYYTNKGETSPLGPQGEEVAEFLRSCVEESDTPSAFLHIYQAKIGRDTQEGLSVYNRTKK